MINALIGKITGILDKDFLFASFLPALIFLLCLATTFASMVGLDAVWIFIESWSIVQKATIITTTTLGIVVFAYILNAFRAFFAQCWSGNANFPPYLSWGWFRLAEARHKRRFHRMREQTQRHSSDWSKELDFFQEEVRKQWDAQKPLPDEDVLQQLIIQVNCLHEDMSPTTVRERLHGVIEAFQYYSGEGLSELFRMVKLFFLDMEKKEQFTLHTCTATLDREYGAVETVKATVLGNTIEAYNQYPFKRYSMEAEIFWPRLHYVIKAEFLPLVQEPRILLDFSVTMASLALIFGFIVLLAGPWIWFNVWLWSFLAAFSFVVSFFFYRLSIKAAVQLGEIIRSSFDLFRLDLMAALNRPHPQTLRAEREQWSELSRHIVYGEEISYSIRPRKGRPARKGQPL